MDLKLQDPACQTLYEAFKQKQNACVFREDFAGASAAKIIAQEVRRLCRQLVALRSLHKASLDQNKIMDDIDLDDINSVRTIRERKNQKLHKDVMRDREEESILNQLDIIRAKAIASSNAVGVVLGIESFVSTKHAARDHVLQEQLAIDTAGMKELDMILHPRDLIPVDKYIACHQTLEHLINVWVLNSTEQICYPPELTTGQQREFDFVLVLFGDHLVRSLLSRSSLMVKIGLQALDYYVPTLAKELGVDMVFKTIVFLLTVVLSSLDGHSKSTSSSRRQQQDNEHVNNGTPPANGNEGVRESAVHLCKTLFTWIPMVAEDGRRTEDDGTNDAHRVCTIASTPAPNWPVMLFQSIDAQRVGVITMEQFRNAVHTNTRVRELVLAQEFLSIFLIPTTEKQLFASLKTTADEAAARRDGTEPQDPFIDMHTFCDRIQLLSPVDSHPFETFASLSAATIKVAVVALMPHFIQNIQQQLKSMHLPIGCNHGKDPKSGDIYPLGGVRLFDSGKVRELLDVIHHISHRTHVGVEFVIQLVWPDSNKTTATHLIIINSLLSASGFINHTLLSPECILPLAASCLFDDDPKLAWSAEHLIALIYRFEEFTTDTTSALVSLQIPSNRVQTIEQRLCREFKRLDASKNKGCPANALNEPPKRLPKNELPVKRTLLHHRPGYTYQGSRWPPNQEEDDYDLKRLRRLGQAWSIGQTGETRAEQLAREKKENAEKEKWLQEQVAQGIPVPVEDLEGPEAATEPSEGEEKETAMLENTEETYMAQVKSTKVDKPKLFANAQKRVGKPAWKTMTWEQR